jgi:UDP-N-acetylmuramate--alanine ligase
MRIYFSGIGGVGIGPLALIAADMGHDVVGSDMNQSRYTDIIESRGITVHTAQTGKEISQEHQQSAIDWLVVSSALPTDHPEILYAQKHSIKVSKRDELLNQLITEKKLKLIAIAGTHGKTTTTGMIVWALRELGEPVSYSVGSNLSFGPSGHYDPASAFFIYEADEYDHNFLHFRPYVSIVTSVDYDHMDIFKTEADYTAAFADFINQSHCVYMWQADAEYTGVTNRHVHAFGSDTDVSSLQLLGEHNRRNGYLAWQALKALLPNHDESAIMEALSSFPGTERRFEKLSDYIYTDYAHHPQEIAATIQLAKELKRPVVVIYQPHQNSRQHQVRDQYKDAFKDAAQVYWLPTYLSREDPALTTLQPAEFTKDLSVPAEPAEMDDALERNIRSHAKHKQTVVLMSAGTLDAWARERFSSVAEPTDN